MFGFKEIASWLVVSKRQLLEVEPWFRVQRESIELPTGQIINDYYTISHREHVVVFAMNEEEAVICLWGYKHGPRQTTLGLPAGYIEDGELPLDAGKRELLEETGHKADVWSHLGSYTVDGNRGFGKAHIYRALRLNKVADPAPGDLEQNTIEWIDQDSLKKHLLSGKVKNMSDAVAISVGLIQTADP